MELALMNFQKFRPEWLVIREYLRSLLDSSEHREVTLDLYAMADVLKTSYYRLQEIIETLIAKKLITARKDRNRYILLSIDLPPYLIEEYNNNILRIAEKRQMRALEKSGYRR